MELQELKNKHFNIWAEIGIGNPQIPEHTKLSIQFAIEALEEQKFIISDNENLNPVDILDDKIQELKQYLDECN